MDILKKGVNEDPTKLDMKDFCVARIEQAAKRPARNVSCCADTCNAMIKPPCSALGQYKAASTRCHMPTPAQHGPALEIKRNHTSFSFFLKVKILAVKGQFCSLWMSIL